MIQLAPLNAVFFDIGGSLGNVTNVNGVRKLRAYASSKPLLKAMGQALGLRVGVISNVPTDMSIDEVRAMLAAAGLLALLDSQAIITSQEAGAEKPDAKIFEFAAQRIGVPITQCLYIGEDPKEVAGARTAGMAGIIKPSP